MVFSLKIFYIKRIAVLRCIVWVLCFSFLSSYNSLLSFSRRPRLLTNCTFNGVFLGFTQRQTFWHFPRKSIPQGCGAGEDHVGGGRIHLQLQLVSDDSEVSPIYVILDCVYFECTLVKSVYKQKCYQEGSPGRYVEEIKLE